MKYAKMQTVKVLGQSMESLLLDGDTIFLQKIEFRKIKVNDILSFKKLGENLVHRVINKNKKYLITKGDNTNLSDGKIYPKNILGIVTKIKRNGQIVGISDFYLYRSTLYFKEISNIKRAFDRAKINFVILKGLPLYLYLDGSYPKRIYADCDILIQRSQYFKVNRLFEKNGYSYGNPAVLDVQKGLRFKETEVHFFKTMKGTQVVWDVHFEIKFTMSHLSRLDQLYPQELISSLTGLFMREKRFIKVQKESFPILSSENLFIYLLLHLFRHNFKGSYRFEFITKVIKHTHLNYNEITRKIVKYKLENFVYPGLLLLKRYYGVRFTFSFLKPIEPSERHLYFIKKSILNYNIFDGEERKTTAARRLINLLFLSPGNIVQKGTIFLNPNVIYAILRSITR